jgi:hypothetical protein
MSAGMNRFEPDDMTDDECAMYQEFWEEVRSEQRLKTLAIQKADELMTKELGCNPFRQEIT